MPLINYIGNRQECLDNKLGGRGNAPAPIFLDYLVVGGGQYSTDQFAGGGGGVVSGSIRFLPRFTLDITVGDGGTGSILKDAEASTINVSNPAGEFFVYAGPGLANTSGEPQNNPKGANSGNYSKGGAGGSAQIGQDAPVINQGGAGGSGSLWSFDSGSSLYGGGGGNGEGFNTAASNGVNGTGGGAGGVRFGTNTDGGSGIVKLRYISGSVTGATGGTISVSGSYVYHTYTGSGQFIYQP